MDWNSVILQYFEWNAPPLALWKQLRKEAPGLAASGIGAVWIPPAYKGRGGLNDRGYGVYDLYDLGEFYQKGSVPTRYGTRGELLDAISTAHANGLEVYADIVLNHRMGADGAEIVEAEEYRTKNRLKKAGHLRPIKAWTSFTFPGRGGKYSEFKWSWRHFTAIDYDGLNNEKSIFKFRSKRWARQVDRENGNFDYLMGASLDLGNREVKEELARWGIWFANTTGIDGFRLDAVKHMRFTFYNEWLNAISQACHRDFFVVGEYWNRYLAPLARYMAVTRGAIPLFDAPLHYNFHDASQAGADYDLRTIFAGTLTGANPGKAVTFVDNHDTEPGQGLESWVADWFKPHAYALILLRQSGRPCVFYGDYHGDYHGAAAENLPAIQALLPKLLHARKFFAHGKQNDYFDEPGIVGWTREGDGWHAGSGVAVLLANGAGGEKLMHVGARHAGKWFHDITGNIKEAVKIGEDGKARFRCGPKSIAVWAWRK